MISWGIRCSGITNALDKYYFITFFSVLTLFSPTSQNTHVFTLVRNGPLSWMASEMFSFLIFRKKMKMQKCTERLQ